MKWLLVCLLLAPSIQAQPDGSVRYEVDPAASDVYWLVYSAGALSGLGHNHVIAATELSGTVDLLPGTLNSEFQLEVPVESLQVDDPERRRGQGEGFSSIPSERAVAATRRNMLGDRLLNAAQFPLLRVSGTGPMGVPGTQTLQLVIELAGQRVERTVPVAVTVAGETIDASGQFQLSHEELGLEPFSAMLGTLKVADQMDFHYRVVARRMK